MFFTVALLLLGDAYTSNVLYRSSFDNSVSSASAVRWTVQLNGELNTHPSWHSVEFIDAADAEFEIRVSEGWSCCKESGGKRLYLHSKTKVGGWVRTLSCGHQNIDIVSSSHVPLEDVSNPEETGAWSLTFAEENNGYVPCTDYTHSGKRSDRFEVRSMQVNQVCEDDHVPNGLWLFVVGEAVPLKFLGCDIDKHVSISSSEFHPGQFVKAVPTASELLDEGTWTVVMEGEMESHASWHRSSFRGSADDVFTVQPTNGWTCCENGKILQLISSSKGAVETMSCSSMQNITIRESTFTPDQPKLDDAAPGVWTINFHGSENDYIPCETKTYQGTAGDQFMVQSVPFSHPACQEAKVPDVYMLFVAGIMEPQEFLGCASQKVSIQSMSFVADEQRLWTLTLAGEETHASWETVQVYDVPGAEFEVRSTEGWACCPDTGRMMSLFSKTKVGGWIRTLSCDNGQKVSIVNAVAEQVAAVANPEETGAWSLTFERVDNGYIPCTDYTHFGKRSDKFEVRSLPYHSKECEEGKVPNALWLFVVGEALPVKFISCDNTGKSVSVSSSQFHAGQSVSAVRTPSKSSDEGTWSVVLQGEVDSHASWHVSTFRGSEQDVFSVEPTKGWTCCENQTILQLYSSSKGAVRTLSCSSLQEVSIESSSFTADEPTPNPEERGVWTIHFEGSENDYIPCSSFSYNGLRGDKFTVQSMPFYDPACSKFKVPDVFWLTVSGLVEPLKDLGCANQLISIKEATFVPNAAPTTSRPTTGGLFLGNRTQAVSGTVAVGLSAVALYLFTN